MVIGLQNILLPFKKNNVYILQRLAETNCYFKLKCKLSKKTTGIGLNATNVLIF